MRSLRLAGATAVLLATAGAGSASAATLSSGVDPGYPAEQRSTYVAASGEVNDVSVTTVDDYTLRVSDPGAVIATGRNCTSLDPHTAECSSPPAQHRPYLTGIALHLGDGNDRAETSGRYPKGLEPGDGGPGDDVIAGDGTLEGGGGRDTLRGGSGQDLLIDGDDPQHPDADVLDGGGANDTVSYADRTAPVFVNLGSPRRDGEKGEDDKLIAINSVVGGHGADRLSGSGGHNKLEGMRGDDRLEGRGGGDDLHGGRGHDVVLGRLGGDTITGGDGDDRLYGGQGDDLFRLRTGRDDVDCGRASDLVIDPSSADYLEPRCEVASFGHFESIAYPVEHRSSSVDFHLGCPRRNLKPLSGSMRIRESGGRRRTLAYRRIHRSARTCRMHPKRGFTVRLGLTSLGRRMASRDKGVHSTVEIRGWSFRNVDWTIELHD